LSSVSSIHSFLLFSSPGAHPALHSFPTRRSSDLRLRSLGGQDAPPLEQGLTEIVDGCLTLSGAVADSMPRNLGWDLMEVGRKIRSEEHTSELQSRFDLVCRLLLEKKKKDERGTER